MIRPDRITSHLLQTGESDRVAFVESVSDLDQIGQTVCAMLNSSGGVVLVNASVDGSALRPVNDMEVDTIRDFLHQNVSPRALYSVTRDETLRGSVVSLDIPRGPDRPYMFKGAIYLRKNQRDVAATSEELRQMMQTGSAEPERWERRISSSFESSDIASELLNDVVQMAVERRGYAFENTRDKLSVLSDLSLMRFGQLTNAADVLFGKKVSVRYPQTRVRCVRYKSDKADNFIDEQLLEGPAFNILENIMVFFKRNTSISAEFAEDDTSRLMLPEYSFQAVREGLVNALVHRDYAGFSGSVSVSVYSNRVEIWNSGGLPKQMKIQDLKSPTHASILINPDISHVFYLRGLMERVGRGTYKIVEECRRLETRQPEWKSVMGGVRLTIFAATPENRKELVLNPRQRQLLEELNPGQEISTAVYLQQFADGVTDRQARRDLSELEELGLLEKYGKGPATVYQKTEKTL
jgi:ATP-dependent DNA helicase RecG